jgi:hypothetical protein
MSQMVVDGLESLSQDLYCLEGFRKTTVLHASSTFFTLQLLEFRVPRYGFVSVVNARLGS